VGQHIEFDPASVAGKAPPITHETDLLIIGAGPAGLAAAMEAAGRGVRVTLVDENPVPLETMGEEVPLHFGGRMGAALSNRNAMLEAMLDANPELGDLLEAGVDVRLGTAVWGLFPQRPTAAWIEGRVAGLADGDSAYLMRFGQVIVAAGRRDMGLAFEGWQRPGVMGASAAYRLRSIYGALDTRVAVLLGSDTHALQIANALSDTGVRIAAIVEQDLSVLGDAALLARLVERGAHVYTQHVVREALGDAYGVKSVTLCAIDANHRHLADAQHSIQCDTVLLGVAAIPAIELLEAAGCKTAFVPDRGGNVALVDESQRTSLPFVFAAGDCAGVWDTKHLASDTARREGRIAAVAALRALGAEAPATQSTPGVVPETCLRDPAASREAWVRASVIEAKGEPFVCQCEEVTAVEILTVRPPRYLDWTRQADPATARSLASLVVEGPPSPDIVKRLTRACMGPCQGRRCREQVATLLSIGSATPLAGMPVATFRSPVRPLPLSQLAALGEVPALGEHWDSWFGIASQWVPFWRATPLYTAGGRETGGVVASE
jgi:thioredoxin reductase